MKPYAIERFNHRGRRCLLALALTNVALMLEAPSPSHNAKTTTRLIAAHQVIGYLFCAALFFDIGE